MIFKNKMRFRSDTLWQCHGGWSEACLLEQRAAVEEWNGRPSWAVFRSPAVTPAGKRPRSLADASPWMSAEIRNRYLRV